MTETDFVTWSNDYRLNWTNFKAESNPAIFEDSHSVIKYGFTWLINSDELNDEIVFLIDNIEKKGNQNILVSSLNRGLGPTSDISPLNTLIN